MKVVDNLITSHALTNIQILDPEQFAYKLPVFTFDGASYIVQAISLPLVVDPTLRLAFPEHADAFESHGPGYLFRILHESDTDQSTLDTLREFPLHLYSVYLFR